MRPDLLEEALSRGVIGGLVTHWHRDWLPRPGHFVYVVETADGQRHRYEPDEASAFADAIFAAERAARDRNPTQGG